MALKRLGLFGGSFDPLHNGHLILARCAFEQLRLDELWFIPSALSADKKRLSPAKLRLRWLRAALRGEAGFHLWTGELERGGVSRSIDTVRDLRAQLGDDVKFFLLLGEDQALQLPQWKEADALAKEVTFGIFSRNGSTRPRRIFGKQIRIKAPLIELSSTEIRKRVRDKKGLTGFLPESIRRDLVLHRIYT